MGTEQKLIFNGDFVNTEKPVVPATSRGLMYGDGCFETLRSYQGSFLHLEKHLHRFERGAKFLGLKFPVFFSDNQLQKSLERLLQENGLSKKEAVIRFQLWREGRRGYQSKEDSRSHFSVTVSELPDIKESIRLAFVETKRIPDASLPSAFKLSNNINYITAAREASGKGADDALMQTVDGYVSETTIANIFWINDGIIFTPSKECDLLPGITRNVLAKLCERIGYEVNEGKFKPAKILKAETAWVCNSVREILPVSQIADTKFDVHYPVILRLKKEFERYKEQKFTS